jgi:hypothetical protein
MFHISAAREIPPRQLPDDEFCFHARQSGERADDAALETVGDQQIEAATPLNRPQRSRLPYRAPEISRASRRHAAHARDPKMQRLDGNCAFAEHRREFGISRIDDGNDGNPIVILQGRGVIEKFTLGASDKLAQVYEADFHNQSFPEDFVRSATPSASGIAIINRCRPTLGFRQCHSILQGVIALIPKIAILHLTISSESFADYFSLFFSRHTTLHA